MTDLTGYDSVAATVAEWRAIVPVADPQVIGSYTNGHFANSLAAKAAFPNARHVTYDVNGSNVSADILDVEPSDAVPAQFPAWAKAYKGTLPHPAAYESASTVAAVVSDALDAGLKRDEILIQSAHYTGNAHICGPDTCGFPQADATQYADHGLKGQNTDLNLFAPHFFGVDPKPKFNPHYGWFDTTRRAVLAGRSELSLVQAYDRLRKTQTLTSHPNRTRLTLLRGLLRAAAGRLGALPPDASDHRGWRRRELLDRANGKRLV